MTACTGIFKLAESSKTARPPAELAAIAPADPCGTLFKVPEQAGQAKVAYAGIAADACLNPSSTALAKSW